MKSKINFRFVLFTAFALAPLSADAALLNVQPEFPTIDFSGSGMISFQASSGEIQISGMPSTFFSLDPFIYTEIQAASNQIGKSLNINFSVDINGSLLPGASTSPDLLIIGSIDLNGDGIIDHSGTLLTADVLSFGFMNGSANNDDVFDLIMQPTGGDLLNKYLGYQLVARLVSETSSVYSSPFQGHFTEDWQGQAKGVIGTAPASVIPAPVTAPPAIWLIVCAWLSSLTWFKPKR